MSQSLLTVIAGAAILILGGIMLIWWFTGRLKRGTLRRVSRLLLIPVYALAMGFVAVLMARAQTNLVPQETLIVTPTESMVVSTGTLVQTLSSTGSLASVDDETLIFSVSAPVTEVLVSVGDHVQEGDVLATVDSTAIQSQITNAELNLRSAQASLDALTAPPSDLEIEIAELNVQSAQAALSSASQTGASDTDIEISRLREELSRNQLWQAQLQRDMSQGNSNPNQLNAAANEIASNSSLAQTEANIDVAELNYQATVNDGPSQSQLASANAQYISAEANLNSLLDGASDSQIRQAEIQVETAQLALDSAQEQLENATLVAPFDAIVAAVNIDEGEMPTGTGDITLIDTSGYTITLSIDEKDISNLQVGQTVSLSIQALPNLAISGTVTHIDPIPAESEGLVTYSVEVSLDSGNDELRPGMTAVAKVTLNELSNVIVVPNRFITTDTTTGITTVKVQTGTGAYEDVVVTVGAQSDNESEIVSGLSTGQTLVILPAAASGDEATQQGLGLGLLGGARGAAGGMPEGGAPPGGGGGAPPAGAGGGQ